MNAWRRPFKYTIPVLFTACLTILVYFAPHVKTPHELVIYDVHPDSPRIIKDDGTIEFADYVRIRNMTDHPYDLTGLFLSDSAKDYAKLPLDGVVLDSGGSVMIKLDPSWNFALKRDRSENVYLSDMRGNILFKYTGSLRPDSPVLSAASGFYDDDFLLKMSVKGDSPIYYTLDGSEPDQGSYVYDEPIRVYDRSEEPNTVVNVPNTIKRYLEDEYYDEETGETVEVERPIEEPVDKAFIVRAASIDEYGNKSDTVTREYFFCKDKYRNIISVVADRDDLFGPYGIVSTGAAYDEWYQNGQEGSEPDVNYNEKGRAWEVAADMEYFRGSASVLTQKCGLRLQGRTTRDRRIKNFQLRARNCYSGTDVFGYDFFDDERIRSDGIVFDDNFNESVFYDLVEDEDIIKPKTTDRVALFINGEFWNNVYIRQRVDEKYFEDHYGIAPDNLVILSESFPETDYANEDEYNEIRGWYSAIDDFADEHDLADEENYEALGTMMDVDSFIDYLAINTWAGNTDWAENNNDMYWRVKVPYDDSYGDGRFRWMLHDGDSVFNDEVRILGDWFTKDGTLYANLLQNEDFRNRFAARLEELGDTAFSEENIRSRLESGKWDEPELARIEQFLLERNTTIQEVINRIRNN